MAIEAGHGNAVPPERERVGGSVGPAPDRGSERSTGLGLTPHSPGILYSVSGSESAVRSEESAAEDAREAQREQMRSALQQARETEGEGRLRSAPTHVEDNAIDAVMRVRDIPHGGLMGLAYDVDEEATTDNRTIAMTQSDTLQSNWMTMRGRMERHPENREAQIAEYRTGAATRLAQLGVARQTPLATDGRRFDGANFLNRQRQNPDHLAAGEYVGFLMGKFGVISETASTQQGGSDMPEADSAASAHTPHTYEQAMNRVQVRPSNQIDNGASARIQKWLTGVGSEYQPYPRR